MIATVQLATQAQFKYICDLLSIVEPVNDGWETMMLTVVNDAIEAGRFTKRDASKMIDSLKSMKRKPRETAQGVARSSTVITQDGMYRNPSTGMIYKVQKAVHGSGKLYAKLLTMDETEAGWKAHFEYKPGVIRDLRPEWRMTIEEAREFGALYGTCLRCGRTLTREESIERAMGPVCSGRENWA